MSRPLIEIKFSKLDCLDIVLQPDNPELLLTQLGKRIGQNASPYEGEPAVIDISAWPTDLNPEHLKAIGCVVEHTLAAHIQLVGIKSQHPEHATFVESLNQHWVEFCMPSEEPTANVTTAAPVAESPVSTAKTAPVVERPNETAEASGPVSHPTQGISDPTEPMLHVNVPATTLIIEGSVRSGQKVYARGADAVIMGQVSPGAEVIADGNIHVYGPLKGRALAGASGNRDARIVSTAFAAELVAVAGFYMTFESGYPTNIANQAVQVFLDASGEDGTIRIKPISIR